MNSSLKNVVVPEGIITIEKFAFYGSKIETIVLPSSLRLLDSYAFDGCSNLSSVEFKEGIETKEIGSIKVTNVTLSEEKAKSISKKQGTYITIEFPDITDYENSQKIKTIITKELKKLLKSIFYYYSHI